jgi:hypothetical protein
MTKHKFPADFSYEWAVLPDGRRALIFNEAMWSVFERKAECRNTTAQMLIATTLIRRLIELGRHS